LFARKSSAWLVSARSRLHLYHVKRRPPLLSLTLFLCTPLLHAAEDSPVFIVQNQPVAPTTVVPPPAVDQPARVTLPDGRALSAWLEGPELHVSLAPAPAFVFDPKASPGCPPALATFPDGSALLVWRGHGKDGLRDLRFSRLRDGNWTPPALLNPDGWRSAADPVGEGPSLDSRGAHVAVAWFTAAEGPRINVSVSSNAGVQWLMPNRVDDIAPLGRVSIVLLDDGAQLVSWVEQLGGHYLILLRRISPRGTLSVPVQLVRLPTDPGHPRLTRVKDGDTTPAQLLLAYIEHAAPAARLITLPDASLLAEADACDCDPRPEDQRGYALKGRVLSIDPNAGTITLAHDEVPGVMKAATRTFKAAPPLFAAAQPGKRVFARIERIGPDWWLFNLRTLVTP
jgi:hypothetical protein